jgi:hypothetical protein
MSEMSMAAPLGGAVGDPGGPTTYVRAVDGDPLGRAVGDPEAPTTYVGDIYGGPSRRRCRRLGCAHHRRQRR